MNVALQASGVFVPGYTNVDRGYWMCPFIMPNKLLMRDFMQAQGVFCYLKTTAIVAIDMPEAKLKEGLTDTVNCKKMFANACFLPVNFSIPKKEMDIMIKRTLGIISRYQLLAEYLSKKKNIPLPHQNHPIAAAKL